MSLASSGVAVGDVGGIKRRAKKSKGGAGPWGSGNGRRRPCLSAERENAGGVTGLEQRNALARRLPTA